MTGKRTAVLCDLGGSYLRFACLGDDLTVPPAYRKTIISIEADFAARRSELRDDLRHPFHMALNDFLTSRSATIPKGTAADLWLSLPCDVSGPLHAFENLTDEWQLDEDALQSSFGLNLVKSINDFEAVAWGVRTLSPAGRVPIGERRSGDFWDRIVIIGPGTALGAAALVPIGDYYRPVPTEFGHTSSRDVAPITELREVLAQLADAAGDPTHRVKLRRHYGLDLTHNPPSRAYRREYLASGPGIQRLFDAHKAQRRSDNGPPSSTALSDLTSVDQIIKMAKEGDPNAVAVLERFCTILGRDAADLAATFTARGEVVVVGWIANAIGADHLERFGMRQAFDNAFGRKDGFPEDVPLNLEQHPNPGLLGLADLAARTLAKEFASGTDGIAS